MSGEGDEERTKMAPWGSPAAGGLGDGVPEEEKGGTKTSRGSRKPQLSRVRTEDWPLGLMW